MKLITTIPRLSERSQYFALSIFQLLLIFLMSCSSSNGYCQIVYGGDSHTSYRQAKDIGNGLELLFKRFYNVEVEITNLTTDDNCVVLSEDHENGLICGRWFCSVPFEGPSDNRVHIKASKDPPGYGWLDNGMVSAIDLLEIQKHLLGMKRFFCMFQFIAADANGNGGVTAGDISAIQMRLLGGLPSNLLPAWSMFSWEYYVFPGFWDSFTAYNPSDMDYTNFRDDNTFIQAFNRFDAAGGYTEGRYVVNQSEGNYLTFFDGIKIGDVNFTRDAFDMCPGNAPPPLPGFIMGEDDDLALRLNLNNNKYTSGVPPDKAVPQSPSKSIQLDVSPKNLAYEEVIISTDELSDLGAIQFYLFVGDGTIDITDISSDLPFFDDSNYRFDSSSSMLNFVWFDKGADGLDRNNGEKVIIKFKRHRLDPNKPHPYGANNDLELITEAGKFYNYTYDYSGLESKIIINKTVPNYNNVIVYPNPCKDFIYIVLDKEMKNGPVTLQIISPSGSIIYSRDEVPVDGRITLNITDRIARNSLNYFRIYTKTQEISGKFVVMN